MVDEALTTVLDYHERTKHHPHRYAASLGFLDWANQPDPFRTYVGAAVTLLPLTAAALEARYEALYTPGAVDPQPLTLESVGAFFELALGLSAWKQAGTARWALRCNPSSGNLHPTEGYLIGRGIPGVADGVHHYGSRDHALEHRCQAAPPLPDGAFLLGLSSIIWREAWKYGERAFRYCQHDAGHAIAAARYAAATLGWSALLLEAPGDDEITALLGLDRAGDLGEAEPEHPEALLLIGKAALPLPIDLEGLVVAAVQGTWRGTANRLSDQHYPWPIIDAVAAATKQPPVTAVETTMISRQSSVGRQLAAADQPSSAESCGRIAGSPSPSPDGPLASAIIRQRRSAVAFDGHTGLTDAGFYGMLERLLPRERTPPWDVLPWTPLIHPMLLVHRVQNLTPGLYAAPRDAATTDRLRTAMDPGFLWQRPPACPHGLALYLLKEGDALSVAQTISCHQEIAADGVFTLGMLADYERILKERGPWWYRRLFWEAGVLGQALYLEAEALGIRSTGIGCYFDDLFHGLLALRGQEFQDLYHFTVGGPVEDTRIQTLPPYAHLSRSD
jgi:SagB-type dehydrogenase family enzyme